MESSILLFLLVTLGALISSLTGLGGGTVILAGLMMVYPPEIALPLHSFTQFTANAMRSGIQFRQIQWKTVGAYAALMLPAAWLGAEFFDLVNPSWLKIIVGSVILISVLPIKFKGEGEPKTSTFVFMGALSGFLGIFVGAVGPMVVPFFNRLKLKREAMLVTKSAGQMMLQLSKIIAFSGAAAINFGDLKSQIGILIVGSLIGVLISIPLGRKIPDDKFNQAVTVLLVIISLKVLGEGFVELNIKGPMLLIILTYSLFYGILVKWLKCRPSTWLITSSIVGSIITAIAIPSYRVHLDVTKLMLLSSLLICFVSFVVGLGLWFKERSRKT